MRIGYRYADRQITYPDADNLSTCIRISTPLPPTGTAATFTPAGLAPPSSRAATHPWSCHHPPVPQPPPARRTHAHPIGQQWGFCSIRNSLPACRRRVGVLMVPFPHDMSAGRDRQRSCTPHHNQPGGNPSRARSPARLLSSLLLASSLVSPVGRPPHRAHGREPFVLRSSPSGTSAPVPRASGTSSRGRPSSRRGRRGS